MLQFRQIVFIKSIALTLIFIAYWIAFGPHGPRAEDPPGTGARIFWMVMAGVGASIGIFGAIRMAAKPAPHTMTKEWQEASNEMLKVSFNADITWKSQLLTGASTATTLRPPHWYYLRGLQRPWHGPVSSQERLNALNAPTT